MKKVLFGVLLLCSFIGLSFAQDATTVHSAPAVAATPVAAAPEAVTTPTEAPAIVSLTGTLIDNLCATANKEKLADFVKTHTKECAIKPECAASGYSFYADGVLYALDSESTAKIAEFLKTPDSKLEISIEGRLVNGKLSIVSIKL